MAGHGGQTKDLDGDEEDGYDEVIYPVDFRQVGHITDDEMHRILVKPLQPGTRLTAIFDSCHSGTALDLPYIYSTQGILKEPNLAKEAGQGLLSVIASYSQGDIGGMIKKGMGFFKKATGGEEAHNRALATKTSPADVIMLSGSKDDQTSYVSILFVSTTFGFCLLYFWLCTDDAHSHVRLDIRYESAGIGTQSTQCLFPNSLFFLFEFSFGGFQMTRVIDSEERSKRTGSSGAIRLSLCASLTETHLLPTAFLQCRPLSSLATVSHRAIPQKSHHIYVHTHVLTSISEPMQPLPPKQPAPCPGPSSPP